MSIRPLALPTAAASVRIFFVRASGLNGFPLKTLYGETDTETRGELVGETPNFAIDFVLQKGPFR